MTEAIFKYQGAQVQNGIPLLQRMDEVGVMMAIDGINRQHTSDQPARRQMHNPEAFVGKVVDTTKWDVPDGYAICACTGKLFPESQLLITFDHLAFDRQFRIEHGLTVEDADWLSEEGYFELMDILQRLGLEDAYHEVAHPSLTVAEYLGVTDLRLAL